MRAIGSQAPGRRRPAPRLGALDGFSVALSRAADHSVLWIAASALLAAGGRRARSGAIRGLAAIAVTSAPLEVTLHGELAGTLPGSFAAAGNSLRVIAPLSFIDKDDSVAKDDVAAGGNE